MKVKVGDIWFDSDEVHICVAFTKSEMESVREMTEELCPNRRIISGRFDKDSDAIDWANKGFERAV